MDQRLRKIEKNVLIPRYLEYKITHELCAAEAKEFADCSKRTGIRVVLDCKDVLNKFKECSNKHWNDDELRREVTNEYLRKRKKFKETGEAEPSPFKRL